MIINAPLDEIWRIAIGSCETTISLLSLVKSEHALVDETIKVLHQILNLKTSKEQKHRVFTSTETSFKDISMESEPKAVSSEQSIPEPAATINDTNFSSPCQTEFIPLNEWFNRSSPTEVNGNPENYKQDLPNEILMTEWCTVPAQPEDKFRQDPLEPLEYTTKEVSHSRAWKLSKEKNVVPQRQTNNMPYRQNYNTSNMNTSNTPRQYNNRGYLNTSSSNRSPVNQNSGDLTAPSKNGYSGTSTSYSQYPHEKKPQSNTNSPPPRSTWGQSPGKYQPNSYERNNRWNTEGNSTWGQSPGKILSSSNEKPHRWNIEGNNTWTPPSNIENIPVPLTEAELQTWVQDITLKDSVSVLSMHIINRPEQLNSIKIPSEKYVCIISYLKVDDQLKTLNLHIETETRADSYMIMMDKLYEPKHRELIRTSRLGYFLTSPEVKRGMWNLEDIQITLRGMGIGAGPSVNLPVVVEHDSGMTLSLDKSIEHYLSEWTDLAVYKEKQLSADNMDRSLWTNKEIPRVICESNSYEGLALCKLYKFIYNKSHHQH